MTSGLPLLVGLPSRLFQWSGMGAVSLRVSACVPVFGTDTGVDLAPADKDGETASGKAISRPGT